MDWLVIFSDATKKEYVNMSLYEVGEAIHDEGKEHEVVVIINNGGVTI